jgi:hypothetical protein
MGGLAKNFYVAIAPSRPSASPPMHQWSNRSFFTTIIVLRIDFLAYCYQHIKRKEKRTKNNILHRLSMFISCSTSLLFISVFL